MQEDLLILKCSAILSNFFLKSETFIVRRKSNINKVRRYDEFGGKLLGLFEFEEKPDRLFNMKSKSSQTILEFKLIFLLLFIHSIFNGTFSHK